MKEKLETLRASIKALLDDAETLIKDSKFDEAKLKQDEAKKQKAQFETIKAQIDAREAEEKSAAEQKTADLEKENAELKAKADKPVRPPFEDGTEVTGEGDGIKSFVTLKYGDTDAATKAVISDLYGSKFNYNQARHDQTMAFVKYIRFGEYRLNSAERELLQVAAKNIILRPEMIKAEVESGRTGAEIKATLEEASNDLGGYLVPEDYRTEIIKRLMGVTVVRGRARVVTTTRDAVEWPVLLGGNNIYTSAVRVTWVDETPTSASVAESNPTFGMTRIPVHTVMARTNLSQNLLEDSAFNLLEIMSGLFAEAMAVDEDAQFLTGTGAGRPYGVLGDRANGAQNSPVTGVTDVNTGSAAAVTADGYIDLVYSLPAQYRANAVHILARTTLRDSRKLKDGDSRYVWQPGLVAGQPQTLAGYPVYESENMDTVAANAYVDIFGSWRDGYIIVDRVGMTVKRVEDTTTTGTNQVALFARRRLGGQVVAPWAFSALQCSA